MLSLAVLLAAVGSFAQQRFIARDFSLIASFQWFSFILIIELPLVALWSFFLYPLYLSPLRKLPQAPQSKSWRRMLCEPNSDECLEWMQTVQNNGFIRYLGLFNSERILLTEPEGLMELLQTKAYQFVKPPGVRKILVMLLGDGLVVAEGSEHKYQRKNMTPVFSFRKIKDLYPVFWDKASEFCAKLEKHVQDSSAGSGESPVTITEWHQRVTLDIICVAGFGHDLNVIQNPETEFYQQYRVGFLPSKGARKVRLLAVLLPSWLIDWLPMKRVKDIHTAQVAVKSHLKKVIATKKEAFANGEKKDQHDMISDALRSGAFSDANLLDQSMTLIAAGHETTSSALTWAAYTLSQNPHIQSRLRDEVRSQLPSPSESTVMTAEVLDALPYLHAVCNEVLRMYSPVSMLQRLAEVDTTLQELPIPKGTNIRASPWALNKSEHLWGSSAHEFIPERWLEGSNCNKGGADSHYSFMTFSQGPRSCIGSAFAKAEFAACLAVLVGRFDIKLERVSHHGELEVEHGITTKIDGGLVVRLKVVDGW